MDTLDILKSKRHFMPHLAFSKKSTNDLLSELTQIVDAKKEFEILAEDELFRTNVLKAVDYLSVRVLNEKQSNNPDDRAKTFSPATTQRIYDLIEQHV